MENLLSFIDPEEPELKEGQVLLNAFPRPYLIGKILEEKDGIRCETAGI
jgi:hypothetical protein